MYTEEVHKYTYMVSCIMTLHIIKKCIDTGVGQCELLILNINNLKSQRSITIDRYPINF